MIKLTVFCIVLGSILCLNSVDSADFNGIWNKITHSVKCIFHKNHSHEHTIDDAENREHGHLDSPIRDLVRKVTNIRNPFSKETKGLDCNKTLSEGKVDNFKDNIKAIFPGTKWCGDGNIASSFTDVGKFSEVDKCCREHDLCPDNIPASSTKYDLENTGLFTRSNCHCDRQFYQCLKNAGSIVANSIGYTYFTILGPQCFEKDYPIVDCAEEKRRRCARYVRDQEGQKMYQWFDNPAF